MSRRNILSLYKKEILDVLRDKKTLIVMILIPLFLYPAMMLAMVFLMNYMNKENLESTYSVGIAAGEENQVLEGLLTDEEDAFEYLFEVTVYDKKEELEAALSRDAIHAYIALEEGETVPVYEIGYDMTNNKSLSAQGYISEILDEYKEKLRVELIQEYVEDYEAVLEPIDISYKNMASQEASMGSVVGMVLPMILIVSILMGAIYPANDVTAGERERGTMETLMTLPVKVSELMTGKFLAVSTIAVFSALLNLLSMTFVGLYVYTSMDAVSDMGLNLVDYLPAVGILLVCLPVFALFTSAVCLCVCIFAKSFKEANNYSTPVLLVFMFASMATILPNINLDYKTALIPIVNISLLIKANFELEFQWPMIGLVILSNLIYAAVAVWVMSKLFSSEAVLFGEGFNGVKLFENRRNMKENQMPGVGDTILMFGIMLLVMIYVSSAAVLKLGIWGTGICQLLILLVPVLYAWYMKADFKKLFSLSAPNVKHLLGGVFMWLGIFLLEQVVLVLLSQWFPGMMQTSEDLNSIITAAGFIPAFIVVGISPAIAEEFAFRGFLFGTIKNKWKPWVAIVISALVFGAYHMNLLQFIGGTMMGIGLGYVAYKSGSIWVGVMMHFINNGLSVIFQFYPAVAEAIPILGEESYGVGDLLILAGVGLISVSIAQFLYRDKQQEK